jgi:sporulation protein YlmC with PRC-barrel domain
MMDATMQFTIGSETSCTDGACGQVTRVVVDPVGEVLTHLVVEPARDQGAARLVPVELVDCADQEIRLRCTLAEFEALEFAQETQFFPGAEGDWGYEQGQMLSWPYYGIGMGGGVMIGNSVGVLGTSSGAAPQEIIHDRVPAGEIDVRRGDRVHATDGDIGRVRGLLVDLEDHHVTHVLLDEGHLWGRKEVAIPIGSVTGVEDGVHLSLTKDQVRDLPPVGTGVGRGEVRDDLPSVDLDPDE